LFENNSSHHPKIEKTIKVKKKRKNRATNVELILPNISPPLFALNKLNLTNV